MSENNCKNQYLDLLDDPVKRRLSFEEARNAENNNNLDIDKLVVKEAYVGKSLRMKRFRPMSKGRAFQIIKPFSRLTLVLEERA